ncbi:MAG: hypothetical protein IKD09_02965 [Lentisphaeria bacterium]|nr:hypothetical protein [Lentisphaeria bacterium]
MSISDLLFGKIKATFTRVIPDMGSHRSGEFLIKQNLAPLMGRRDAAYEFACKLSQIDIFSCDSERQAEICVALKNCLESSIRDTEDILNMLSSPDTVKREKNYLILLGAINRMLLVWVELILTREHWRDNAESLSHWSDSATLSVLRLDEEMLGDCEIAVVGRIKNIFEGSQKGILRYRSYMTKSFSGNYLERYTKALEHYQSKYRSEYDWVDK